MGARRKAMAEICEDEIDVTPEMIEAGARELMGFSTFFESHDAWAVRVYRAMELSRKGIRPADQKVI